MTGRKLAEGRVAEIFAHSPGRVLKLYQARFDEPFVTRAAQVAGTVAESGVTAPRVWGIEAVGDRFGVVMDRIEGGTLFDALVRNPRHVDAFGAELARLHLDIHRCTVPGIANRCADLRRRIESVPDVSAEARQGALDAIDDDENPALSHGDLHPGNVMVGEDGQLVAIDWDFAMSGPPAFDVARAWFLLHHWALAPGDFDRRRIEEVRTQLADSYLTAYLANSTVDRATVEKWMLTASVARLLEPIPEEAELVRSDIDRLLAGQTGTSFSGDDEDPA